MNLLIAWILLTVPVVYIGTVVVQWLYEMLTLQEYELSEANKYPPTRTLNVSLYCLWWGIYFLIKAV